MGLEIAIRSSTEDLVALAYVKARLPGAAAWSDPDLQQLISDASSAMALYLGRPFARQTYTLTCCGNGGRSLLLPRYPIDRHQVVVTINGEAVTDFVVEDKAIGKLYRGSGWPRSSDSSNPLNISITWPAGHVLPDQAVKWAAGAPTPAGKWLQPTSPALSPLLFEVTTAGGVISGSEPTWPQVAGEPVTLGGGAVVIARDAELLSPHISSLCYVEVYSRAINKPPGVSSTGSDGASEDFFATHTEDDLCLPVQRGLNRMRAEVA
jgi:hypothetical protein